MYRPNRSNLPKQTFRCQLQRVFPPELLGPHAMLLNINDSLESSELCVGNQKWSSSWDDFNFQQQIGQRHYQRLFALQGATIAKTKGHIARTSRQLLPVVRMQMIDQIGN